MKYANKLHNALTYSNLLPPPISLGRKYNNKSLGLNHVTLLHQAYAFCGRVFDVPSSLLSLGKANASFALLSLTRSLVLLLMLPFVCMSCEKPDLGTESEDFTRSANQPNDSTSVIEMPIVVDTTWAGTITLEYGL